MNIATMIAVQVATQVAAQESRVVQQLEERGALSATEAVRLERASGDEYALKSLLKRRHVIEAKPGYYYLGEVPQPDNRKRVLLLVTALLLVTLGVVVLLLLTRSTTPAGA